MNAATETLPEAPTRRAGSRAWGWVVADMLCIVAFTLGGVEAHGTPDVWHLLRAVVVPYGVGWFAAAWAVRLHETPYSVPRAVLALPFGLGLGLMSRVILYPQAHPTRMFALVTGGFLALTLVGWRLVALAVRSLQRRSRHQPDVGTHSDA